MALAMLVAAPACAQVSASVSAWSDYRYRGASLSDDAPALQAHVGYDFANDAFAGLLVSSVRVDESGSTEAMALAYAGRTWSLRGDWHVEAGIQYVAFTRSNEYDYAEAYAGLGRRDASVRLHYADDYFGYGPAWYAEYDLRHAFSEHWHWTAHAGLLRNDAGDGARQRRDGSLGVGLVRGGYEWELLWSVARGGSPMLAYYGVPGYGADDGPLLRVTRSW
ncbi:hypothetical protein GCM10027159_16320 [Lysobacter terrae]